MKPKIFFLHNLIKDYRLPWFKEMDKQVDLTLVLFRDSKRRVEESNFDIGNLKYKILAHFKLLNKYGISFPLITFLLFSKYDAIISDDLYFFETYISFFISKLRRKPHLVWVETFEWPRAPKSKLIQPLVKLVARYSNAVIVVGKKSRDYLLKLGAKENRIFISPNASVPELQDVNEERIYTRLKDLRKKQIILYFSRIVRYKGLDILIDAFLKLEKEIKNIALIIATSNLEKNNFTNSILKKISQSKSKNIHLIINKPEDKVSYFSISDVLVLPSTFRDHDADCWGLVLNEAMSLGKPIISTDATGGAHDLIKNGINGYMVKQKNTEELFQALKKILSNKKLKEQMGKESKKIINENFIYEKMAQGCIDAIIYTLS